MTNPAIGVKAFSIDFTARRFEKRFANELSEVADIECAPELVGRNMTMMLAPKK